MPLPLSEFLLRRSPRAGFTLLELSIVLVIIGLLIGGIFVGQSLIHNAQLNAVIQEFGRYETATQAFQQQYNALPGDMSNATTIWGLAGGSAGPPSDVTCSTTASTTTATCNGNGDGNIAWNGVWYENFRFWQHLADAKMIEGSYTGSTTGSSPITPTPGLNVPMSRFNSAAAWTVYIGSNWAGGSSSLFNTDYGTGHIFFLGGSQSVGSAVSGNPIFTPKDAWAIDKKIDDGKPALGNVLSNWYANCTNATDQNTISATYSLTNTTVSCYLIFLANF